MSFTTGTATDHNDLLDQFQTYLLAEGWTVDDYTAGATPTDVAELFVTAPGSLGGEQPRFAIQTYADVDLNIYTWRAHAAINYEGAKGFGEQSYSSPRIYLPLWNDTIDYWFYVNDRRAIVIAKIGVVYHSFYGGFFLPYALPEEYPFPLYIGGTVNSDQAYNLDNSGMRSAFDPSLGAAAYFQREENVWKVFHNSSNSNGQSDVISATTNAVIWPYRTTKGRDPSNLVTAEDFNYYFLNNLRPTLEEFLPMWQAQIIDPGSEHVMPGMLDGVFVTPGFNRIPEQVITYAAQDYRLFISHNRTRGKDFFAIEEI